MVAFRFKDVCIQSFGLNTPPIKVTSAELEDRLAPIYENLKIPFGTLEKLSGVKSRNFWEPSVMPSEAATVAARKAMEASGFTPDQFGALVNCSVTRDFFEPATACLVHRNLELPESSIAYDITNACIGFSDGLSTVASMIESGAIKVGLVVSAECVTRAVNATVDHLLKNPDVSREQLLKLLPTLTLGAGATAFVLCHRSVATNPRHRVVGIVPRTASQFNDLCNGNADYHFSQDDFNPIMETESQKLISSAAKLGGRTCKDMTEKIGWSKEEIDHVFCHQVGKQVNEAFYNEMGLDYHKEFTIYRTHGNLVSAALPTALVLGIEEKQIGKKPQPEKIICTAFGSGLNCRFVALEW